MKKVCILIGSLERGGAQTMALRMMEALRGAGVEVFLFSMDGTRQVPVPSEIGGGADRINRIYHLCGADAGRGTLRKVISVPLQYWRLLLLVRRLEPDLLISFMERANILSLLLGAPVRRIISVRKHISSALMEKSPLKRWLIKALYPKLLRRADTVNFNADQSAADFKRLFPSCGGKISVIPNFYDPIALRRKGAMALCPEHRAIFEKPVVITAGRLLRVKGHHNLIRAFSRVCRENDAVRLVILGEGPLRGQLEELCAGLGIEGRVFLPGFQDNPMPWVARSDLFILPSLAEGFPNALLEAMALGAPVIASDCCSGPREILAPGTPFSADASCLEMAEFGILVPVPVGKMHSATAPLEQAEHNLASAISRLMADTDLRERYRRQSALRAGHFSAEKVLARWMRLILRDR